MGRWIKRIIKLFVVIVCALFIWRVMFAESEGVLGDFIPTGETAVIYGAGGEIEILTNEVVDEISAGGYFSAYGVYYTPETGQLQVTVRYNDSTVEKLGNFSFYAYTVDTSVDPVETSEGTSAESGITASGGRYYEGYPVGDILSPVSEYTDKTKKLFYNYEKLVFENIHIDEHTNIIISLCAEGDPNSEKASIVAHFAEQPMKEYKLSRSEKKALSEYTG